MPASWRASDLTILGVAAAGTLLLTVAAVVVSPPRSLPNEDGSSYAAHGEGARAAYLLLKELGYSVDRSFEPASVLRAAPERTALVIANPLQPASDQDARALQHFVTRGGVVLVTGQAAMRFLTGLPPLPRRPPSVRTQPALLPGPLTSGVAQVEMAGASAPFPVGSPFVPVFGTVEEPAVAVAQIGQGRAIWWAGSTPLVNHAIARPGHTELLINALGPPGSRSVLWDEFYHGHTRSLWSYLAGTPLPIAGVQLAAIGALALLAFSRRRRPVRAVADEPRTSPLEFVDTMGALYQRASTTSAAVSTALARVRRQLLAATGLPASTSDDRLAVVAAERLGLDHDDLATLLSTAASASNDPELSSSQALALVSRLQRVALSVRTVQGAGDRGA